MRTTIDGNHMSATWLFTYRRAIRGGWLLLLCGVTVGWSWLTVLPVHHADAQQSRIRPPAPTCTAQTPATPSQTEGPFYKVGSPQRTRLTDATMAGTKLTVTGYVLARGDCRPVGSALLDFWQADDQGNYDNAGFRLRGHQFTDNTGIYYLETVVPGLYPGRTRHIHVKVRAPNGPILTTQLYFPGEGRNQSDGIFSPALVTTTRDGPEGKVATFTFVVNVR